MATHSRILTWRIPWTEKPGGGGLQSMGSQESDTTERLNTHTRICIYTCTHTHIDSKKFIPKKAFQ